MAFVFGSHKTTLLERFAPAPLAPSRPRRLTHHAHYNQARDAKSKAVSTAAEVSVLPSVDVGLPSAVCSNSYESDLYIFPHDQDVRFQKEIQFLSPLAVQLRAAPDIATKVCIARKLHAGSPNELQHNLNITSCHPAAPYRGGLPKVPRLCSQSKVRCMLLLHVRAQSHATLRVY